ncbi:MAG TPA: PD-(D/E)XK nuclease family protein [Phycisphaerales bacterium]|nr:PD-(D/E)XK nuclease family protein [Phycisphaerales bacterium]
MAGTTHPPGTLAALEAFVTENDELLQLEELIGRFNVFDALRIARAEIRHSNFLAWLLDPAESHGQGDLFLKAVLMDLLRQAPPSLRPLSPVELDGDELRGVEIRREWKNIDLLIRCEKPAFVVAIENKVDSGEHSGQLSRYAGIVHQQFPGLPPMFVFLTPDADEPSDAGWAPYSYAEIHRVLQRVRRTNAASLGGDVAVFLEHYLRLIGSRFMNDPKIDELCQQIYKNHRQALDLIYERVGARKTGVLAPLNDWLQSRPDEFVIFRMVGKELGFLPRIWADRWPPLSTIERRDPRSWLALWFIVGPENVRLDVWISPMKDPELQDCILRCIAGADSPFGLTDRRRGRTGQAWKSLYRERLMPVEDALDSPELLVDKAQVRLTALLTRLSELPGALDEILSEREVR